jgi:hypothetical protein
MGLTVEGDQDATAQEVRLADEDEVECLKVCKGATDHLRQVQGGVEISREVYRIYRGRVRAEVEAILANVRLSRS